MTSTEDLEAELRKLLQSGGAKNPKKRNQLRKNLKRNQLRKIQKEIN